MLLKLFDQARCFVAINSIGAVIGIPGRQRKYIAKIY